jgi:hypothetical protein
MAMGDMTVIYMGYWSYTADTKIRPVSYLFYSLIGKG